MMLVQLLLTCLNLSSNALCSEAKIAPCDSNTTHALLTKNELPLSTLLSEITTTDAYLTEARRLRDEGREYITHHSNLVSATWQRRTHLYSLKLDPKMLALRGIQIGARDSKILGRIVKVGDWPLPEIIIDLPNLERIKVYFTDIVPDSISDEGKSDLAIPALRHGISSPSAAARANNITSLVHATALGGLRGILASKAIVPASKLKNTKATGNDRFVYFEPIGDSMRGEPLSRLNNWREERPFKLIFDIRQLDAAKFDINRHWPFGKQSEETTHSSELGKVHNIFWELDRGYIAEAEVLFEDTVDLKNLKAIWVSNAHERQEVIKILNELHFAPADGKALEEFVVIHEVL